MPVSGHEESGVKSFAGQFSGLVAGVPIKKRRFPSFRPTSPPPEEPCSTTQETELQRNENSSTSQGSTLSDVTIAGAPIKKRRFPSLQTFSPPLEEVSPPGESDSFQKEHSGTSLGSTLSTSSAGLSDTIGNPVFEEKKERSDVTNADMVQNNSCFLKPKLEKSNTGTPSRTSDVVNSKEKKIFNEGNDKKLGSQTIKGNPELLLAAKEGLALSIGADVSKQIVQVPFKQETPIVPESTGLSLSLKEHLFPAVASPEIDETHPKIEKGEPVSLELSLSKEECGAHSLNTDAKTSSDTTRVNSSRENWDLNTTMDAWEEGTDASFDKTSIDGLNITPSALDEKLMTQPTSVVSVKQTLEESQNKVFITSSRLSGQQFKCADPQNLCLSSYLQKYVKEPSITSVKLNSGGANPPLSLPSVAATAKDANTSSFRLVKPEPYDEKSKKDLKEANACPVGSLDTVAVKQEFIQHSIVKPSKSSDVSNLKLVDPTFIKSEPGHEGNQERSKTAKISSTDRLGKGLLQVSFNCSSAMPVSVTLKPTQVYAEGVHPAVKLVCTSELTASKNIVGQLENSTSVEGVNVEKVFDGVSSNPEKVPLETVAIPMVDNGTELTDPGFKHSSVVAKKADAADHEGCRSKLMNEPPDPRDSGEGCVSDEEKITLSTDVLEDDSYGSDYESDDNHAVTVAVDTERYVEDDDYEDGEVRESLMPSMVEDTICEVREVEHPDSSNFDIKPVEKEVVSSDCPTSSRVVENDNTTVVHNEINNEDGMDIYMHEKPTKVIDKNVCVQESLDDEKYNIAADKRPVNVFQWKPFDLSKRKNVSEVQVTEPPSNQATDGSHGVDVVQCADEVVKTTDTVKGADLDMPKMEGFANTDDATKDVSSSGNQGRIIDLSRAASLSSPGKTRPITSRPLLTRGGRDALSDTLDGDRLHRGRDEVYMDAPHKFSRERHQDMSTRNSRFNFVRGRGRFTSRIDMHRGEWESDREYSGEFYNGPSQFRGPRPKYASAVADTDLEYNNNAGLDGSYVNGRLGRKPMNDGSYIAPRRRSPGGGRDGIQMGHRNPRPVSPNRCIGGDGSELVGMRHSEKFMRSFPDDTLDSVYTRPQPFEGTDGHGRFSRGGRNFSSMQRRGGLSRIRSKSPIRSRSRSPGSWSSPRRRSPRRRSPDSFGGHPDMSHRRSPLYRVDRMRSPDRPVFPGERVVRRHGSPPPFMSSRPSNDMRDIDSARDHGGHPRSVISNRSPSGRIMIRNRRFDVVDPRDRADNDEEYFGGLMHSGRLLEFSGEGNGEERRRFGERRGPVRSFRPPYSNGNNNNVGENFHLNAEDGPRQQHYRFCSDDSDFHKGGNNIKIRDFDRRIKGRPGNVPPRRTRNMDEQEENFRHGGQVWSDDSFDDISRVKRKRF